MAIKNTNDLTVQMQTLLLDNVTQDISPLDHRTSLGDTIDSLINKLDNKPLLGAKEYNALRGITPALAYEAGEMCVESGVLYQANIDILAAQAFTVGNWTAIGLAGAINGTSLDGANVIHGGPLDRPTTISSINDTNFLRHTATNCVVTQDLQGILIDQSNGTSLGNLDRKALRIAVNGGAADTDITGISSIVTGGLGRGAAGFFDSVGNAESDALITDRGNIGFGWTDFDFTVTDSLVNIKALDAVADNKSLVVYNNLGTTEQFSIKNQGEGFFKRSLLVGDGTTTSEVLINGATSGGASWRPIIAKIPNAGIGRFLSLEEFGGTQKRYFIDYRDGVSEGGANRFVIEHNTNNVDIRFTTSTAKAQGRYFNIHNSGSGACTIGKVGTSNPIWGSSPLAVHSDHVGTNQVLNIRADMVNLAAEDTIAAKLHTTAIGPQDNTGIEVTATGSTASNTAIKVLAGNTDLALQSFTNDTTAATGGIQIGELYYDTTNSVVQMRTV